MRTKEEISQELANDPVIRKAVEALRPKPGSGIDSVTLSSPGHESVTLTAKSGGKKEATMELSGVEVKKVTWTPMKLDDKGGVTKPPTVALSLEFPCEGADEVTAVKQLLDYITEGACTWDVKPQRKMKG